MMKSKQHCWVMWFKLHETYVTREENTWRWLYMSAKFTQRESRLHFSQPFWFIAGGKIIESKWKTQNVQWWMIPITSMKVCTAKSPLIKDRADGDCLLRNLNLKAERISLIDFCLKYRWPYFDLDKLFSTPIFTTVWHFSNQIIEISDNLGVCVARRSFIFIAFLFHLEVSRVALKWQTIAYA